MSEEDLRACLRGRLDGGGRIFVPYVTGGLPSVDAELLRGVAKAGADAIEVGIPFSDPVIDGGVIQTASRLALEAGATPGKVLQMIGEADIDTPVVVMTYLNPVHAHGQEAFLREAAEAGVSGVIVPDLPVDEASDWIEECSDAEIAPVFLAAPGTAEERLRDVAAASRGFVYCVATYGVTGERSTLEQTSRALVGALRPFATEPLIVGVGIGTPAQAAEACGFADGVIVGTALMRALMEEGADAMLSRVSAFRDAVPLGTRA
ncbi:MAG: tryptophan synthase subunit alpha [Actinomycetota bacterium]